MKKDTPNGIEPDFIAARQNDDPVLRYYEAEMRYLRESGREFARAHPDRARMLNLDRVGDRVLTLRARAVGKHKANRYLASPGLDRLAACSG